MKFAEDDASQGYFISSYDDTSVHINGKAFHSSLIIAPDAVVESWPPETIEALCIDHCQAIIELQPELVIIGSGNKLTFPHVETYASLIQQNIGVEIMDSGAACRTYNILMGEGRRVVAAIIIAELS